MAKLHIVKCKYCNESFDCDSVECVKPTSNRYAHKKCYDEWLLSATQEEKDFENFFPFLKELFGTYDYLLVERGLKSFRKDDKYSYDEIKKSLTYFYKVKGNPIEKANGGIGIVPFIRDEAMQYYNELDKIKAKNNQVQQNITPVETIKIPSPQIEKKKKKLFSFLDEGEN